MKKYQAIYKHFKDKIVSGEYGPGQKLPSKRLTAQQWGCSVITVETAFSLLADEGYLRCRERSGYFVCPLDNALRGAVREQEAITPLPLPEGTSQADGSLWFKAVRKVIAQQGEKLLIKAPNMGCPVLRNAISDYLRRARGMWAPPQRIVIGSGAEQLYEIVVKLLGRDKLYGIEDPSYPQIQGVYTGAGARVVKLTMGPDGIDQKVLEQTDPDVLHVTPFRSFPTDVTTSLERKYGYLKWAKGDKWLVEDDFNSEFSRPGQPIETLYALKNDRVIYINTFSKSLWPSMRIGYMILPESLMEEYERKLGSFSCPVPVLDQYVLAEFIAGGDFERHLNRTRRLQ